MKENLDKVFITDLLVRGVIGVYDYERDIRQDILINMTLFVDTRPGAKSDQIENCVSYHEVAEAVISFVEKAKRFTVEALSQDIADLCLCYDRVEGVRVRVEKPGVLRFCRSVGVEIERFVN